MKLGKTIKYKGESYELKAIKSDGERIIYLVGKPEWDLSRCIELERKDFT